MRFPNVLPALLAAAIGLLPAFAVEEPAPILAVRAEDNELTYRGTVLDPEEGRNYGCLVTLLPGGKHLRLRGFVGFEIFGRDETWVRLE